MIQSIEMGANPTGAEFQGAAGGNSRGSQPSRKEVGDLRVTPQQAMAIELIAAGRSVAAVAVAVGVDRSTLYRWRTEDEDFMVVLERWRLHTQLAARDRLMAVTEAANDAIEKSVTEGDARLGYKILAAMGCMSAGTLDDPERGAIGDSELRQQFGKVARTMTPQQRSRAADLLALGVQMDNERLAREHVAASAAEPASAPADVDLPENPR